MGACGDKKDAERGCYELAMKIGLKGKGGTRRLLRQLDGRIVERKMGERPDLVVDVSERDGCSQFFLGIEHFIVDQASEELDKKPGKFISKNVEYERRIKTLFDERPSDNTDRNAFDDWYKGLVYELACQMKAQSNSSYKSFIRHMSYVVGKHLANVAAYRETVSKECGVEVDRVRLAFLMDIRTNFSYLFINKLSGKVRRCHLGELPFFEEVVTILERLQGSVDYAILVMNYPLASNSPKVVAIETDDVRRNLEQQHEYIYSFAASSAIAGFEDGVTRDFEVAGSVERGDNSEDFVFRYSFARANEDALSYVARESAKIAWEARQGGKGFVTDIPAQTFLTYYGNSIKGWIRERGQGGKRILNAVVVGFDREEAEKRMRAFEDRWISPPA